jgi:rod shape-determining protein MreB
VVNIGGGTTDIAAISPTGAVFNKSIKIGSELIDDIIRKTLYEDHKLLIGKATAEKIKKRAITLLTPSLKLKFSIKGKDIVTGLPKILELSQKEICKNTMPVITRIIDQINDLLNNIPLDLFIDIQKSGILLTGGGSLIPGFQELVSSRTNILTNIAKNPINCAAFGALNSSTLLNEHFSNFIIPA